MLDLILYQVMNLSGMINGNYISGVI